MSALHALLSEARPSGEPTARCRAFAQLPMTTVGPCVLMTHNTGIQQSLRSASRTTRPPSMRSARAADAVRDQHASPVRADVLTLPRSRRFLRLLTESYGDRSREVSRKYLASPRASMRQAGKARRPRMIAHHPSEEQRRRAGCSDGRMPSPFPGHSRYVPPDFFRPFPSRIGGAWYAPSPRPLKTRRLDRRAVSAG